MLQSSTRTTVGRGREAGEDLKRGEGPCAICLRHMVLLSLSLFESKRQAVVDVSLMTGAVMVAAAALAAAGTAVLVRAKAAASDRQRDTAALGTILTIITGLHAVFVVFVLVGVIESGRAARHATSQEADNVIAAVWATDVLPAASRQNIHAQAIRYVRIVLNHEWPRLRSGQPAGPHGWEALQHMRRTITEAPITTEAEMDRRTEASDRIVDTYLARQARLLTAQDRLGPTIWFILTIGTMASIVLAYLYCATSGASYPFLVATVAGMFTMLLFAIYQLQDPFGAAGTVSPEPLRTVIERLGESPACLDGSC